MQIISKKKSTEKNKNAWEITLEDDSVYLISVEDYYTQAIYCLDEADKEFFENLSHKLLIKMAKSISLRWVLVRIYTVSEVSKKLKNLGYNDNVIKDTLEYLQEQCYLDDKVYAEKFTNQRMKLKPVSKQRLSFELQSKGIEKDIVNDAIEKLEVDDEQIAQKLYDKRFVNWDFDDPKQYKKAVNFMLAKGFSMSIIKKIIKSNIYEFND